MHLLVKLFQYLALRFLQTVKNLVVAGHRRLHVVGYLETTSHQIVHGEKASFGHVYDFCDRFEVIVEVYLAVELVESGSGYLFEVFEAAGYCEHSGVNVS